MSRLIIRRLLMSLTTIFAVLTLTFFLFNSFPGTIVTAAVGGNQDLSPEDVARLEAALGLDQPVMIRYIDYLTKLVQGDFGRSLKGNAFDEESREPVSEIIAPRLLASLKLAVAAMTIAIGFGVPLGIIAAWRKGGLLDSLIMFKATLGMSIPSFCIGIGLMLWFGLYLQWFPIRSSSADWQGLVLPAITLGVGPMALIARTTRAAVIETFQSDFIRTARAKGCSETRVIVRHVLRNALLIIVTITGLQFAGMLGGTVIIESLFNWPGLGSLLVQSVEQRNIPEVQGALFWMVTFFVLINTLVDIAYLLIDPRIRLG